MDDDAHETPENAYGLLVGVRNSALICVGFWMIIYFVLKGAGV